MLPLNFSLDMLWRNRLRDRLGIVSQMEQCSCGRVASPFQRRRNAGCQCGGGAAADHWDHQNRKRDKLRWGGK